MRWTHHTLPIAPAALDPSFRRNRPPEVQGPGLRV